MFTAKAEVVGASGARACVAAGAWSPRPRRALDHMAAIELWDLLAAYQRKQVFSLCASDRFDPRSLHPEHQVPPLVALIAHEACYSKQARRHCLSKDKVLAMARAMVESGADPQQAAPDTCPYIVHAHERAQKLDENRELVFRDLTEAEMAQYERESNMSGYEPPEELEDMVDFDEDFPCKGRSAVALAAAMKVTFEESDARRSSEEDGRYNNDPWNVGPVTSSVWESHLEVIDALLSYFEGVALHVPDAQERVRVAESVIARWEAFLADESSHDVSLVCEGDVKVGAHARMLSLSSPVVATMLGQPMIEGESRRIPLPDCPPTAARFLLDLVYTGTTQLDPDDVTFLATLHLAHRWQLDSVVTMIETALSKRVDRRNFEGYAEAAQVLELQALRRACKMFAAVDATIGDRLRRRDLRPAVVALLLPPEPAPSSSAPPAKKRRSF